MQNTCFSSNLVLNLVKIPDTRRANLYKTLPCLKNKFVLVVRWDNQRQFYIFFSICQISPILPVEKNKTQRMILMLPIYHKLFMLTHLKLLLRCSYCGFIIIPRLHFCVINENHSFNNSLWKCVYMCKDHFNTVINEITLCSNVD